LRGVLLHFYGWNSFSDRHPYLALTFLRRNGPLQYEDPSGKLMMLPTDMALIWDKKFKK